MGGSFFLRGGVFFTEIKEGRKSVLFAWERIVLVGEGIGYDWGVGMEGIRMLRDLVWLEVGEEGKVGFILDYCEVVVTRLDRGYRSLFGVEWVGVYCCSLS